MCIRRNNNFKMLNSFHNHSFLKTTIRHQGTLTNGSNSFSAVVIIEELVMHSIILLDINFYCHYSAHKNGLITYNRDATKVTYYRLHKKCFFGTHFHIIIASHCINLLLLSNHLLSFILMILKQFGQLVFI